MKEEKSHYANERNRGMASNRAKSAVQQIQLFMLDQRSK